jgi:hypothetical protein
MRGIPVHRGVVAGSVDLDHKPCRIAGEVDDIRAERHLPAELEATLLPPSQPRPEQRSTPVMFRRR